MMKTIGMIVMMVVALSLLVPHAALCQDQTAVVATAASDNSSGAHSVISVDPIGGLRTVQNEILPTISDIAVDAYGQFFYRLERTGDASSFNVTKFAIDAPGTVIWQYSTEGSETGSNPYALIFVSETKAYLLRYGSATAWIVDPSTTTEAGFKTGELDLSAYADSDDIPEMADGVLVGDKLFIVFQRLDRDNGWSPTNGTLVGVFDTATDTELAQITVPVENPHTLQYLEENNTIYVAGVGSLGSAPFGGIATIDPDAHTSSLLLAGDAYGGISGLAVISSTKGYFIGYGGWQDNTLYTFDPSAETPAPTAVTGFDGLSLGSMQNGLYVDHNSMLWICNQTDARVDILDPATDTVDESVNTVLNPIGLAFVGGEQGSADDDDDDSSGCFISTLR
jgi:hypothetical protein